MKRKAGPTLLIAAAALAFGSLALSPSAQEYYEEVRAGSPPTGGRIPIPNGSWYPALGPVSKWAYDWQGVTNSNNGCYGILLWALMDPAFVDRDELWAVEDGYEYLLGYYYDVPRDDPSPFSWEKWGLADGNLNGDQNAVAVFCPGFTPRKYADQALDRGQAIVVVLLGWKDARHGESQSGLAVYLLFPFVAG